MDPLQEVSSTMTEDADVVVETEGPLPQKGISQAEAANALITLQVPTKNPSPPIPVTSSRNGGHVDIKPETDEVSSKDFRKKILEGMKSQFNTSTEDEPPCEPSSRRVPPHRTKSKFKRQDGDGEEATEEPPAIESVAKSPRGRGRPPRASIASNPERPKLLLNVPKKENEATRSERDSSSEAGSERSDSALGSISTPTTRRSQRTNISRTSATEMLKGLTEARPNKKPPSEPEMVKPTDVPRKRGRPSKAVALVERNKSDTSPEVAEDGDEENVSKMEHMASLGLLSKSSSEISMYSKSSS